MSAASIALNRFGYGLAHGKQPPEDARRYLLRQLDAELPTGVALTVIVPATLQGADAERPALSRAVTWQVVDGSIPASSAKTSPPPLRSAASVRQVVEGAPEADQTRRLRAVGKRGHLAIVPASR
mgnify:CR=1 FL=1